MIKRSDWTSSATFTDPQGAVGPASERSAGLMLTAFRSRWDDDGPAPYDQRFSGDTALVQASGPSRLDHSASVASIDFPAVIDLATLDGTNGFRIAGIDKKDWSGFSVSGAGDVNGDGVDDIIISAPLADRGGFWGRVGASYVVFGRADGFAASFDLSLLDGTNGFRLVGIDYRDYSGGSVSSAGDMNGDGFDDIIIGATGADADGNSNAGESYVVFGKAGGFDASLSLATLDGSNGFRLDGIDTTDFSGGSVASAGDVNGDGFDDIIIGAVAGGSNPVAQLEGACYVVFGKAGDFAASIDLASLDGNSGFSLSGANFMGSVGGTVSAGDVNGDGFDDLIIGAYRGSGGYRSASESYVVFGKADGFAASIDLSMLDGTNGFRIVGVFPYERGIFSVSSAGDVNGDGFDDIIIGADGGYPDGNGDAGESYVVFGKPGGFTASLDLATLDGSNGFRLDGVDAHDRSGYGVASAGDINADGFDDIIIGARDADPGGDKSAGESYVVFGHAGPFAASFDLASLDGTNGLRLDGIDESDKSGISVSSAGDVNDDGFDDIIVGAPYANPGGLTDAGESYVIFGRAPTEAVTRIGSAANQTIRGGDFNDILRGEGGNDRLAGGVGADTLNGGVGNDWAYYDVADARVRASLNQPGNNSGEAAGDAYISIENLFGSAFNDKLTGDALANRLRGEAGADTISGANGNDVLAGGAGRDTLTGGKGADSFTFGSLVSADFDTISDFTSGVDRIALDDDVFGFAEGALPPGSFVVAGTAQDADDRVIYDVTTGRLFFDADGTGAEAQILLAVLPGAPVIAASDIIVV